MSGEAYKQETAIRLHVIKKNITELEAVLESTKSCTCDTLVETIRFMQFQLSCLNEFVIVPMQKEIPANQIL